MLMVTLMDHVWRSSPEKQNSWKWTEKRLGALIHPFKRTAFKLSYLVFVIARGLGGVLLQGGSETSSSILQTLVLTMVMFPDAQRKAQDELDRVVGPNRTPRIEDMNDLPYIRAVIDEVRYFINSCLYRA
jgi:hypothetical protein